MGGETLEQVDNLSSANYCQHSRSGWTGLSANTDLVQNIDLVANIDLVEDVPAYCKGFRLDDLSKSL